MDLHGAEGALPLFRDGGSMILNASSTASMGMPAFSVYSATKAAVRNFARCWILDLADRRIRVNAVSPGPIATPGLASLAQNEEQARQFKADMVAGIPLGRLGIPDEVAKAVVFLASDDSSFVNGGELFVDGGFAQI
jgi:NAD(P)-dependent dehydrogenase (short-subunit alcohol dehydrogenase family)